MWTPSAWKDSLRVAAHPPLPLKVMLATCWCILVKSARSDMAFYCLGPDVVVSCEQPEVWYDILNVWNLMLLALIRAKSVRSDMVYLTFRSWYRSPTWWVWSLHGFFYVVDMSLQFWAKSVRSASVNLKFWTWNCSLVPARRVWYGIFNVNDRILQSRCLELKAWGSYQSGMVIIFDIHVTSKHGNHFGNRRFSNQFRNVGCLFVITRVLKKVVIKEW